MENGAWRVWWRWERVCQAEKVEWRCKRTGEVQVISEDQLWAERISGLLEQSQRLWSVAAGKSVGWGSGAGFMDSLVKTGKWSDGDQWVKETAGASEVSEEVMTRSRIWYFSCVGKSTCWLRLKEQRRDRNWEVKVSAGLSRWMLKSPVMMNS